MPLNWHLKSSQGVDRKQPNWGTNLIWPKRETRVANKAVEDGSSFPFFIMV